MSFKVIETQEELDARISDRLAREREKFKDYDDLKSQNAQLTEQINGFNTKEKSYTDQIAQLNSKIKGYETDSVKRRIAHESGLPFEFADRLRGETEEEIKKDAESLALFARTRHTEPQRQNENPATSTDLKLKKMLENLEN